MKEQLMIDHIKQVATQVLPKGSALYLYGPHALFYYNVEEDKKLLYES